MKTKVVETTLDQLIPDDKNMNRHKQYGMHLLEKSITQNGYGRSVLLDKNNRLIAGNGVVETGAIVGLEDVIIVETDGTKLVAVKRNDIDLDSAQGRAMALADNSIANANLEWDTEAVQEVMDQWELKPEDWGVKVEIGENDPAEEWKGMPEFKGEDQMGAKQIIVHFQTIEHFHLFCLAINQKLTEKTKSTWYPEQPKGSQTDHAYTNQEEPETDETR